MSMFVTKGHHVGKYVFGSVTSLTTKIFKAPPSVQTSRKFQTVVNETKAKCCSTLEDN
jgi:DNA-binding helix-hairpin-helix protein with protein kinase domain